MLSATERRDELPSSGRKKPVSAGVGARPRTSAKRWLSQLPFVPPVSVKYSDEERICASICSSVKPAVNIGVKKLMSAAVAGRWRYNENQVPRRFPRYS